MAAVKTIEKEALKAISTYTFPMISTERNLELELKYLNSQRKQKRGKGSGRTDNTPRLPSSEPREKKPKRKVAVLLSYCGTGYQGMQINPQVPSIELDLHKAFVMAGAVSEDNAMDAAKCSFIRCARTDKGVHAAGQVVSLKMILDDDIIEKINLYLPRQIRVWGYSRVNNAFHAKNQCDSRIYEYLLPTYCLQPVDPSRYPNTTVGKEAGIEPRALPHEPVEIKRTVPEDLAKKREYRISPETLEQLRSILKSYEGTKNYHNFTLGKSFKEASSKRYIMSFVVGDPFVRDGIEWVSCKVHGQSFMLHQIRKMMGLAMLMIRTGTPISLLEQCFTENRLNIPKAPALGLLLERPVFEKYNKFTGSVKEDRGLIDFDVYKVIISNQEKIDAFKEEWIYSAIAKNELEEGVYDDWCRILDECAYSYEWYLRPDGQLHPEAMPSDLFKRIPPEANEPSDAEE